MLFPWRKTFMGVAIAICVITIALDLILLFCWQANVHSSDFHPQLIDFNEATKAAYEAKINDSHTIFEYGIVLFGALWALVIYQAHGTGILRSDYPEITMFGCSNLLFVMFTVTHDRYTAMLIDALLYAGKPEQKVTVIYDLHIWEIERLFWLQILTLITFLLVGGMALFSAHRLKSQG